jgi:glutamate dehydrogenase (NAD(P)+)
VELGGSRGRLEATGRGISVVCDQAMKYLGMPITSENGGCRVIIQGFGNVGSNAAKLMFEKGYKIIGIAEYDGGLFNPQGIDINALLRHKAQAKTVTGFPGAEACDQHELITRECEILIPAATENVITSKNAADLKCRILCEGANGPTTIPADAILAEKKIFVLPDILANAGGVSASYFEWVQDRMGFFWTADVVNERLDRMMTESFDDVISYAQTHGVNNRIAAYMLAVDRVAYTTKKRGMYA